jgi:hypothetical protein
MWKTLNHRISWLKCSKVHKTIFAHGLECQSLTTKTQKRHKGHKDILRCVLCACAVHTVVKRLFFQFLPHQCAGTYDGGIAWFEL